MMRKSFNLVNSSNEKIQGDIRYREGEKNTPAIIICHGFKGFKDWGFFPVLAERLADDGYVSITFNFSRNGIGADPNNFTELEQFAKNTYSHELSDLKNVVDAIASGEIGKNIINPEKIGLLGHSRGGGIALLYTAGDERIQCVTTWSAIARIERYSDEVSGVTWAGGSSFVRKMWDGCSPRWSSPVRKSRLEATHNHKWAY